MIKASYEVDSAALCSDSMNAGILRVTKYEERKRVKLCGAHSQ